MKFDNNVFICIQFDDKCWISTTARIFDSDFLRHE